MTCKNNMWLLNISKYYVFIHPLTYKYSKTKTLRYLLFMRKEKLHYNLFILSCLV